MTPRQTLLALRKMVKEDTAAHAILGWFSDYENNRGSSVVDYVEREATRWARLNIDEDLVITRGEAIAVLRQLEELQLGRLILGRRGAQTRFEFWVGRVQIGQAAMGVIDTLNIEEAALELEEHEIIDAHRMLIANALGKPVTAVQIRVKE